MARSKNLLLHEVRGNIGKQIVVKQYANGTVISKMPDMSKAGKTPAQAEARLKFKMAQAYAKSVLSKTEIRNFYEQNLKPGQTVYHAAISAYMKGDVQDKPLKSPNKQVK